MLPKIASLDAHKALRARAISRLRGVAAAATPFADAPDALRVLYDLASSPATAPQALALLHELQVHQVEVDLQNEELRHTRAEMEASLARQIQLHDAAPVAYLCIEPDTTMREVNLTAARVLGLARDLLPGRKLEGFLRLESRSTLQGLLAQLHEQTTAHAELQLMPIDGTSRAVLVSVSRDPAGDRFLLAIAESSSAPAR